MGLAPQPFLAQAKPSVDRLLVRMQAAEQRLRQSDPGLRPLTGTEPPAIAFARPPAVPAAAPEAPPPGDAAPAHGSH
jgi:outer membrane protein TolC